MLFGSLVGSRLKIELIIFLFDNWSNFFPVDEIHTDDILKSWTLNISSGLSLAHRV